MSTAESRTTKTNLCWWPGGYFHTYFPLLIPFIIDTSHRRKGFLFPFFSDLKIENFESWKALVIDKTWLSFTKKHGTAIESYWRCLTYKKVKAGGLEKVLGKKEEAMIHIYNWAYVGFYTFGSIIFKAKNIEKEVKFKWDEYLKMNFKHIMLC